MNRDRPKHSDFERIHTARFKKGSEIFEVVIDSEKAVEFREGGSVDIRDVVSAPKIFSDAKRGMLASEMRLNAVFGTSDALEIAKEIVLKGQIPETQKHKSALVEQMRSKILSFIHSNGVDPRTNAPHPLTRLENAFEQANVKFEPHQNFDSQLQETLKRLRTIIPIKFALKQIEVNVDVSHAVKALPVLKQKYKVLSESWLSNGALCAIVELPGGLQEEFEQALMSATKGSAQFRIIKTETF